MAKSILVLDQCKVVVMDTFNKPFYKTIIVSHGRWSNQEEIGWNYQHDQVYDMNGPEGYSSRVFVFVMAAFNRLTSQMEHDYEVLSKVISK